MRSWSPGHGLLAQTISQTEGKVTPLLCPLPFPCLFKRAPRKIFFFKLATESQSSCATRGVCIFSSWTPVKHILIKLFLFSLWTKRRMTAGKSWWELSLHTFRSYRDKGRAPCCGCDNNNRESPCWGPRAGAWHIVLASKRIQDEQEREIKEGSQSYLHMETVAGRDAILCPISQSCSTSKSSGAPNSPKSQLSALIKNCFRA